MVKSCQKCIEQSKDHAELLKPIEFPWQRIYGQICSISTELRICWLLTIFPDMLS